MHSRSAEFYVPARKSEETEVFVGEAMRHADSIPDSNQTRYQVFVRELL